MLWAAMWEHSRDTTKDIDMDGQRQRSGGRRRRRRSKGEPRAKAEPVLIHARRPDSPLLNGRPGRAVAASAAPKQERRNGQRSGARTNGHGASGANGHADAAVAEDATNGESARGEVRRRNGASPERRQARIVRVSAGDVDDRERERLRLLDRVMLSDGRGAISRAATAYAEAGFEFPHEQEVQLQLLEHFDEDRARCAVEVMAQLVEKEPPIKKPILEQRLRRLEEYGEDEATRDAASSLRRAIR